MFPSHTLDEQGSLEVPSNGAAASASVPSVARLKAQDVVDASTCARAQMEQALPVHTEQLASPTSVASTAVEVEASSDQLQLSSTLGTSPKGLGSSEELDTAGVDKLVPHDGDSKHVAPPAEETLEEHQASPEVELLQHEGDGLPQEGMNTEIDVEQDPSKPSGAHEIVQGKEQDARHVADQSLCGDSTQVFEVPERKGSDAPESEGQHQLNESQEAEVPRALALAEPPRSEMRGAREASARIRTLSCPARDPCVDLPQIGQSSTYRSRARSLEPKPRKLLQNASGTKAVAEDISRDAATPVIRGTSAKETDAETPMSAAPPSHLETREPLGCQEVGVVDVITEETTAEAEAGDCNPAPEVSEDIASASPVAPCLPNTPYSPDRRACESCPPVLQTTEHTNYPDSTPQGADPNSTVASAPAGVSGEILKCKLANVTEQRVLKAGLIRMHSMLTGGREKEIAEIPNTKEITRKMLGRAFLTRLLRGELELKSCMENDVASAQSDLRYLTLEQLLLIRVPTLNFQTEAFSHSARNSFLETLDKHLFSKIPPHCQRGDAKLPAKLEHVHAVGLRIALVVGAAELFKGGWGSRGNAGSDSGGLPMPPHWVFKLTPEHWPCNSQAALLHTDELWLQPLPGEKPDFCGTGVTGQVAVIADRTRGIGKDRMLHWEIALLDPQQHDILAELEPAGASAMQQTLAQELTAVLARQRRP